MNCPNCHHPLVERNELCIECLWPIPRQAEDDAKFVAFKQKFIKFYRSSIWWNRIGILAIILDLAFYLVDLFNKWSGIASIGLLMQEQMNGILILALSYYMIIIVGAIFLPNVFKIIHLGFWCFLLAMNAIALPFYFQSTFFMPSIVGYWSLIFRMLMVVLMTISIGVHFKRRAMIKWVSGFHPEE